MSEGGWSLHVGDSVGGLGSLLRLVERLEREQRLSGGGGVQDAKNTGAGSGTEEERELLGAVMEFFGDRVEYFVRHPLELQRLLGRLPDRVCRMAQEMIHVHHREGVYGVSVVVVVVVGISCGGACGS